MNKPDTIAEADYTESTWAVMEVLRVLAEHGGFLGTAEVALRADVGRDTARRILRTLTAGDSWVTRLTVEGRDVWSIGPRLAIYGLAYQEGLVRKAHALSQEAQRLANPRSIVVGVPRLPPIEHVAADAEESK